VVYEAKNSSAAITVGSNRRLVTGNAVTLFEVLSTILCEISFSQSLKEWQIMGYFSYRV